NTTPRPIWLVRPFNSRCQNMLSFIFRSIRNKLMVITGFGTVLVIAAAIFGLWQGWRAILSYESLIEQDVQAQMQIGHLLSDAREQGRQWAGLLLRGMNEADHARHWNAVNALQEALMQNTAALTTTVRQPDVLELLQKFATAQ